MSMCSRGVFSPRSYSVQRQDAVVQPFSLLVSVNYTSVEMSEDVFSQEQIEHVQAMITKTVQVPGTPAMTVSQGMVVL